MGHKDTLVIVPSYNESLNIEDTINDLKNYFDNILVIDDGSIDKTSCILQSLKINYIKHPTKLGQGAAIDSGLSFFLNNTNLQYIITFDGDGQHEAKYANEMTLYAKEKKLSAVLGSRFKNRIVSQNIPFFKKLTLAMAKVYQDIFFQIHLTDAHNGLRIIDRKLVKKLIYPIRNFDMSHATEISFKICKSKYKFEEYPVRVKYGSKRSQNPINAINIAFKNIFFKL